MITTNPRTILTYEHKATKRRVILADMPESDIRHLIELAQDPDLVDFMGWDTYFSPNNPDAFLQALSEYSLPDSRPSQPVIFGIYLDMEDQPIGYIALKGFNMELLTCEIAVAVLDKKSRRSGGYGRLAMTCMTTYAFQELNVQTIWATILYSNKESTNMVKRLGFAIREVMYNSWTMPSGEVTDMLWLELKRESWDS